MVTRQDIFILWDETKQVPAQPENVKGIFGKFLELDQLSNKIAKADLD